MDRRQSVIATPRERPGIILVLGEINPYGNSPEYALWHEPRGASGDRLRRIMGLSDDEYLEYVARANLCAGHWSTRKAREAFRRIDMRSHAAVIFLGSKVRGACSGPSNFELGVVVTGNDRSPVSTSFPHPSGRNRAWGDPVTIERARAALVYLAPGIPWGTAKDKL
jgi:hypothetical protein